MDKIGGYNMHQNDRRDQSQVKMKHEKYFQFILNYEKLFLIRKLESRN